VHAIAGGNGAGKSTLIKIVSGAYSDYEGELVLDGSAVRFSSPAAARRAGIATIYQELSLCPNLSLADNLELSRGGSAFARIAHERVRARAFEVLARVGLTWDPDTLVEELSLSERQLLEIGRAVSEGARVLVMDEPTSALSEPEVERLFAVMRELLRDGVSILYISHRHDEIERMAQHISVLRDGRLVLSAPAREVSRDELVRAMLGDAVEAASAPSVGESSRVATAIRVRGLTTRGPGGLRCVGFEARVGEVLGFAGLGGSGAALTLSILVGEALLQGGDLELFGQAYRPESPGAALGAGVAFLPSDRARSVFYDLSVTWNATLSSLPRYTKAGFVSRRRELADTLREGRAARLKASSPSLEAAALSGGNQQKLALMRCLLAEPRLLLLDDPTRGVDAAAKSDIARLLRQRAEGGLCVLVFSSELEELIRLCDRVLVFFGGRVVSELSSPELDREHILKSMMGSA